MNCPECRNPILDSQLACPFCTERKSLTALLDQAKVYLPAVISGQHYMKLRRANSGTGSSSWHFQLVAGRNVRTYCGLTVAPQWKRLSRYWDEIQRLDVCGCCSDALARLAKEISEHAGA